MPDCPDPELTVLWAHPQVVQVMAERAPACGDLHRAEDVLAVLHEFGRVRVDLRDDGFDSQGLARPRYVCATELREDPEGVAEGRGPTLEHAALRCLADILEELRDLSGQTLSRLDVMLSGMANAGVDAGRGLGEIETFLSRC